MGGGQSKSIEKKEPLVHDTEPTKRPLKNLYDPFTFLPRKFIFGIENVDPSQDLENFDFLPANCLHNIALFFLLEDIFHFMTSCKLFHSVVNSSYFWQSYYVFFFDRTRDAGSKSPNEHFRQVDPYIKNWKEEFYRRIYFEKLGDELYYREKYRFQVEKPQTSQGVFQPQGHSLKMCAMGKESSGMYAFLNRVRRNQFFEYCEKPMKEAFIHLLAEYTTEDNDNENLSLEIFLDVTRHRDVSKLPPAFFRLADVAMIFFGIDCLSQFEGAKKCFEDFLFKYENEGEEKEIKFVLVGCKAEPNYRREVRFLEHIFPFLQEHNTRKTKRIRYVETSSKYNINVFKAIGIAIDGALLQRDFKK